MASISRTAITAARAAPTIMGPAAISPVTRKAATIPGKATWLTASPIRLCRRRTRKLPRRPQDTHDRAPITIGTKLSCTNSFIAASPEQLQQGGGPGQRLGRAGAHGRWALGPADAALRSRLGGA